jgi:hypothetical protein
MSTSTNSLELLVGLNIPNEGIDEAGSIRWCNIVAQACTNVALFDFAKFYSSAQKFLFGIRKRDDRESRRFITQHTGIVTSPGNILE